MTPVGIVLVFIDEKGRAIANAADFDRTRPAGFTVHEVQRIRAKRLLAVKVFEAYASTQLARAIDEYDAEKTVAVLCRQFGCSIHEVVVGEDVE